MSNKNIVAFSIDDIQEVATENSNEFFYARMCVLSTRPNSHHILIPSEVLKRDGESIRGKWVVANPRKSEQMSHDREEYIVGIVPENARIEYVDDSDGYTYMYADCVLSKIYAKPLYEMFLYNDKRDVSVEMQTADLEPLENGDIPIEALNIVGVTILGAFVNGSCPDANIEIVQFSEQKAKTYYDEVITFSEKSTDNKEIEMADIQEKALAEQESEKDDVIMADADVETMSDTKSETEEDTDTTSETKEDEPKEMATPEVQDDDDDDKDDDKDDVDDDDDDDDNVDNQQMSDAKCDESTETQTTEEMGDEIVESETTPTESVEELGLCGTYTFSDFAEEDKEFVEENSKLSAKEFMSKAIEANKELSELRAFKADVESKEKDARLSAIMASVKGDLDEKTFGELQEEGKTLSLNEINGFENKVKAFAYENTKKNNKKDSGIMTFAGVNLQSSDEKELTADDIFTKYLQ